MRDGYPPELIFHRRQVRVMASWYERREERRAREVRCDRAMRAGATDEEVAKASGLNVDDVRQRRRFLGLALAVAQAREKPPAALTVPGQRAECVRYLGPEVVEKLAPVGDMLAIQQLYAAVRFVLLDAGELVAIVRDVLREGDLQRVAARRVDHGDGSFKSRLTSGRAAGGKRDVVRGAREGRS